MFSVHAAEQPWDALVGFVAADLVHPPLFYVLLKLWIGIGGSGIGWLRSLPLIFGCLALVPFFLLARELKLKLSTVAVALFLLSFSGILINYTQRVRMYTLLMVLSLTAIWLFIRYLRSGRGLVPLVIVNILAIYTHYYAGFMIASQVLLILAYYRQRRRSAVWLGATAFLAFLPWALLVISTAGGASDPKENIGWIARPGLLQLWTFLIDLIEPVFFQFSSEEPPSRYLISLPLLCIWAAIIAIFGFRFKREQEKDRALLLVTAFALVPMMVAFSASWVLPYSIWGARHLIVSAAPLAIAAAMVIERMDLRGIRVAVISSVVGLSLIALGIEVSRPRAQYLWCRWDAIGREFAAATADGKSRKAYTFETIIAYHLWFASRGTGKIEAREITDMNASIEDEIYFLPRGFDGVQRVKLDDISGDSIWTVFRTHSFGEEAAVITELEKRGYTLCQIAPEAHGQTRMFVIEFVRGGTACSR
jgi:uncharacterized membrane protein